jgi:hypothetical protein
MGKSRLPTNGEYVIFEANMPAIEMSLSMFALSVTIKSPNSGLIPSGCKPADKLAQQCVHAGSVFPALSAYDVA